MQVARKRTDRPEQVILNDLVFTLRRSERRRTVGITVDRDGALVLHAPAHAELEDVRHWAGRKRGWVYRKLAEKDLLLAPPVVKDFVSGEGFQYLGRNYRLKVSRGASAIELEEGRLLLPARLADQQQAPGALVAWYRYRALKWLPEHVALWSQRMRTPVQRLEVQDLGYRWGSLGGGDRLNLHWATMQLPPSLLHYVIAHELAHTAEPNHTPAFWATVARAMPDFETRKLRLAHTGAHLWLPSVFFSGAPSQHRR